MLGNDTIDALGGNDFVYGQSGDDTITGGNRQRYHRRLDLGTDTAVFADDFGDLTIIKVGSTYYISNDHRHRHRHQCREVHIQRPDRRSDGAGCGTVNLGSVVEDVGGRDITAAELLAAVTDVDTPSVGRSITAVSIASGGGTLTNPSAGVWHYVPAVNANRTGGLQLHGD